MSSERSISPDALPRSHSRSSLARVDDKDNNGYGTSRAAPSASASAQKRRREASNRTPSPASPVSRSRSRSSRGSKSPGPRHRPNNQRSPSPNRQASSTSKRRRHKGSDDESGRRICSICSKDVETNKRLFGILDHCDHVFCYECIVSWKRSKYSNAESESCPVCKTRSAFITPSKHWYENPEEKDRIVKKHKNHLKTLPCRYYLRHGFCRYSDRCFYDHHEAARQYRQQNGHSRERDRERDRGRDRERDRERERDYYPGGHHNSSNGSRAQFHSPSPPSRYSSSRHRERAY